MRETAEEIKAQDPTVRGSFAYWNHFPAGGSGCGGVAYGTSFWIGDADCTVRSPTGSPRQFYEDWRSR